ncbi:MAG: hypothetical protein PHX30_03485 [Candidatus Pacebacteria bacterium]|nr:hypothetical protein [Candidatus Paceibacterota bacterium]
MERGKSLICLLLVFLIVAMSGCSGSDDSGDSGQAGVTDPDRYDSEASANHNDQYPTSGKSDYGAGDSSMNFFNVRDSDFKGGGNDFNMIPYCIIPVMEGDIVEISVKTDVPARFLLGDSSLCNHFIPGATIPGVPGMQDDYESRLYRDCCSQGSTEYYNRIEIGSGFYEIVFAVQDMEAGGDVQGHMTINIYSEHTQDEHWKIHHAIMQNNIEAQKRKNEILDIMVDQATHDADNVDLGPYEYGQRLYPD